MIALVAGILLLVLGLYGLKLWTRADPKVLAQIMFRSLAYAALLGAVGALVTGRFAAALPLAVVGLGLLGRLDPGGVGGVIGGMFRRGQRTPRVSQVRSALFEMELDHRSGALTGRIISGPRAGENLDGLGVPDLVALRRECDAQSLSLLEAYLDRRAPAWRENAERDDGPRGVGGNAAGSSAMSEDEAYQILGLQPGASAEAVRAAHRTLMKKLHPDHGGSSYLAARINQAKEVILRKHG